MTGGGPMEGPPVFGPEAYECEFINGPPTAVNEGNKLELQYTSKITKISGKHSPI